MLTDDTDPLIMFKVITAPNPSPITSTSGGELYPLPEFCTITWTILPFSIIGFNWQLEPEFIVICGWWSRFKISEDPYPTPLFSRCTDVTEPLKTGMIDALSELASGFWGDEMFKVGEMVFSGYMFAGVVDKDYYCCW